MGQNTSYNLYQTFNDTINLTQSILEGSIHTSNYRASMCDMVGKFFMNVLYLTSEYSTPIILYLLLAVYLSQSDMNKIIFGELNEIREELKDVVNSLNCETTVESESDSDDSDEDESDDVEESEEESGGDEDYIHEESEEESEDDEGSDPSYVPWSERNRRNPTNTTETQLVHRSGYFVTDYKNGLVLDTSEMTSDEHDKLRSYFNEHNLLPIYNKFIGGYIFHKSDLTYLTDCGIDYFKTD